MSSDPLQRGAGFRQARRPFLALGRCLSPLGKRFSPLRHVPAQLSLRKGQTALEFVCGGTAITERLSPLVGARGRVYVVETDARAIGRLNRQAARRGWSNVVPLLLTVLKLPLNTRSVDTIVVADFFTRVDDTQTFFRELHRVIKPNGRLLLARAGQAPETLRRQIQDTRCWQINSVEHGVYTCLPRYVQLSPPPVERRHKNAGDETGTPLLPTGRERRTRSKRSSR